MNNESLINIKRINKKSTFFALRSSFYVKNVAIVVKDKRWKLCDLCRSKCLPAN